MQIGDSLNRQIDSYALTLRLANTVVTVPIILFIVKTFWTYNSIRAKRWAQKMTNKISSQSANKLYMYIYLFFCIVHGIILVHDLSNRKSCLNLNRWLAEVGRRFHRVLVLPSRNKLLLWLRLRDSLVM